MLRTFVEFDAIALNRTFRPRLSTRSLAGPKLAYWERLGDGLRARVAAQSADVRFGSQPDMTRSNHDVRYSPESGHSPTRSGCLLWARNGQSASQQNGSYSITSSAAISRLGGTVSPSALAVLRLTTNSNLEACITGRSAGLSPLRILPTYTPACR
jgi:hypothetical protein